MPYDDQVALGIVYRMFHTLKMRVEFIGFVVVLVYIISWEYYLAKETYRWFASTDPIAVDHDKDGDIDLTDISASLAALSNDALLKIRAYADELGDGARRGGPARPPAPRGARRAGGVAQGLEEKV